jgi:hypothetical protein
MLYGQSTCRTAALTEVNAGTEPLEDVNLSHTQGGVAPPTETQRFVALQRAMRDIMPDLGVQHFLQSVRPLPLMLAVTCYAGLYVCLWTYYQTLFEYTNDSMFVCVALQPLVHMNAQQILTRD